MAGVSGGARRRRPRVSELRRALRSLRWENVLNIALGAKHDTGWCLAVCRDDGERYSVSGISAWCYDPCHGELELGVAGGPLTALHMVPSAIVHQAPLCIVESADFKPSPSRDRIAAKLRMSCVLPPEPSAEEWWRIIYLAARGDESAAEEFSELLRQWLRERGRRFEVLIDAQEGSRVKVEVRALRRSTREGC